MEDEKILDLYFERNEDAIAETDRKYGGYLGSVAYAILYDKDAADECKNDTYFKTWCAIPPARPSLFKAFLAKITRHTALDRYDYETAKKRDASASAVWEEIEDAIPSGDASPADTLALKEAVNGFLASLRERERIVFLQRYFFFASLGEIARQNAMTEGNVKVSLHRTRQKFKQYLEEKGIML